MLVKVNLMFLDVGEREHDVGDVSESELDVSESELDVGVVGESELDVTGCW